MRRALSILCILHFHSSRWKRHAAQCNKIEASLGCRFTRSAEHLEQVGRVLLGASSSTAASEGGQLTHWKVATDAFDTATDVAKAVYAAMSRNFDGVQKILGHPTELSVTPVRIHLQHTALCSSVPVNNDVAERKCRRACRQTLCTYTTRSGSVHETCAMGMTAASRLQEGESLQDWLDVFRTVQSAEVWETHGEWIRGNEPTFGPGTRERFEAASQVNADAVALQQEERTRCTPSP
jgi:hypothetical protein